MKKYIPLDFDEKGKAVLGKAKDTPTPNGTIPAIFIPGGSDEEKQGLKSISISPAIQTTPALDSLFPIYWDDLTEEEKTEGVHFILNVESGIINEGDEYTLTYTPTAEWYAASARTIGEKGEPMTMTVTAELNDRVVFNNFAVTDSYQPGENTKFLIASLSIQV